MKPKNPGSFFSSSDLLRLWQFLNPTNAPSITSNDLKTRFGLLGVHISAREAKFLVSGNAAVTYTDMCRFVSEATFDFDPVKEAFKIFAGSNDGDFIDIQIVKEIYSKLGYGVLNEADFHELVKQLDADGDGKINENDFRKILNREEVPN
jgi:Ca2+-binding EF-hand superfamily protein